MCGIAGKFNYQQQPVDPESIRRMAASIAHRGPDDDGYFIRARSGSASAVCRSSTSPAGISRCRTRRRRSGSSSTGRSTTSRSCARSSRAWAIAFAPLRHRGDRPRLQAVGQPACPERLNGMFGLAIWDASGVASSSPATRWASSSCTTSVATARLTFGSEMRAVLAADRDDRSWIRWRSTCSSGIATRHRRSPSTRASASWRPAPWWSSRTAGAASERW